MASDSKIQTHEKTIPYNPLTACYIKSNRFSTSCSAACERTILKVVDFLFLNPSIFLFNSFVILKNKISACCNQKSSTPLKNSSSFDPNLSFRFRTFKTMLVGVIEKERNNSGLDPVIADSVLFLIQKDVSENFLSQDKFLLEIIHLLKKKAVLLLLAVVMTDYHEAIQPLVTANVNLNAVNLMGDTPLHMAARFSMSSTKTVELLLHFGANKNILNMCDQTPFMLAKKFQNHKVAEALQ